MGEFIPFSKGISPKVNVIENVRNHYDGADHRLIHYTTETPTCIIVSDIHFVCQDKYFLVVIDC